MSMVAAVTPFSLHHRMKQILWGGEERDTFPTAYKLNTSTDVEKHCTANGLRRILFRYLDDCRITGEFRVLNYGELTMRRVFAAVGIRYPESCILAVYVKD
jgi:hypothetical protein